MGLKEHEERLIQFSNMSQSHFWVKNVDTGVVHSVSKAVISGFCNPNQYEVFLEDPENIVEAEPEKEAEALEQEDPEKPKAKAKAKKK